MELPDEFKNHFGFLYEGNWYTLSYLPFGFSGSPAICQHRTWGVAKTVIDSMGRSIIILVYLDDFLVMGHCKRTVEEATLMLRKLLRKAGFYLDPAKNPTQAVTAEVWLAKIFGTDPTGRLTVLSTVEYVLHPT